MLFSALINAAVLASSITFAAATPIAPVLDARAENVIIGYRSVSPVRAMFMCPNHTTLTFVPRRNKPNATTTHRRLPTMETVSARRLAKARTPRLAQGNGLVAQLTGTISPGAHEPTCR